jgi:hypothetical protein
VTSPFLLNYFRQSSDFDELVISLKTPFYLSCKSRNPISRGSGPRPSPGRRLKQLFSGASKPSLRNIFNKETDSDRRETSLIVNGGHYMTRGHVILRTIYIKMHRMSRTILEPEKDRFGYANGPPPEGFSSLHQSTNSCSCLKRCRLHSGKVCSLLTHPLPPCRTHFTPGLSQSPEPANPFRSRRKEKKPPLDIHDHIVYIGFIFRARSRFGVGSKRSGPQNRPLVW